MFLILARTLNSRGSKFGNLQCIVNVDELQLQGVCFWCFQPEEEKIGAHLMVIMSPPEGLGDILFFPGRPSVRMSVRLSVRLSVTNRVRSVT